VFCHTSSDKVEAINYLTVLGRQIEYSWYGPDSCDSPTLVFLHDGLGCLSLWRDFPARVAEANRCCAFVYSRFGYGNSDPIELPRPVHFMHDEALNVLPAILEAAKIERPILIGHSDGGSIALIYSGSKFGANVNSVILEAPHVFVEDITIKSIYDAGQEYLHGNLKPRLERHHGKNVDIAFWGWNQVWLNPEFRSWNIEEYLPHIRKPVLAIQGEDDNFGTSLQIDSISKKCSGDVQTAFLPRCAHTPHREQPELTFELIVNFIRNHL
jgi:pimeloyl-ACP methyl ester carboxylesterase